LSIVISDLTKSYQRGSAPVLRGVSLEVGGGELLVVVGPSGSGKSTLLRCIAGLAQPDSGSIFVGGVDVTSRDPGDRDVAMVFQDYALYPHLNVETNIAFPLLARKMARDEIRAAVAGAAAMLDLSSVLDRRPGELSGGERRRVSLARAVVRSPKAFLMDEPLSSLDAALKLRVEGEIRSLQARLGVTTIYVTHDQTEAMTMGHRIAVLREGGLEQVGEPLQLYDEPANVFVATFLGRTPMNLFPATTFGGSQGAASLGVRPERIVLKGPGAGRLDGTVIAVDHLGSEVVAEIDAGGQTVFARLPRDAAPEPGRPASIDFADSSVLAFDGDGKRIGP
jgi:multiple sugar transport system ATP-binding protein